ncbi:MAG: AMP-binding protein [Bacteroidaceae bacterium]|nr:AMP-binding protein [Bacteroidaceae bacterium]
MKEYTEEEKSFNLLFESTIKSHWNRPALTDYQGQTLTYANVAEQVEQFHLLFQRLGIERGEKISLCGKNCSNWAVCFFATVTYGAIAVPILHEFKPEQIQNIVNHSDSRLLFVSDNIWKEVTNEGPSIKVPDFIGAINIHDYAVLFEQDEKLSMLLGQLSKLFTEVHPDGLKAEDVHYVENRGDDLAIINYTSGSTGKSKGVMLSQKNLWNNVQFGIDELQDHITHDGTVVSILPMAHMYGLAFEILSEICMGMHIYFLTKLSPTLIFKAFSEIRPTLVISVPLVIEKIIRRAVVPKLQDVRIRTLLHLPLISTLIKHRICRKLTKAFGDRFYEVIIGGAAFSEDVENILKDIGFRYTVGYGTTECAPLITYAHWYDFPKGSCGRAIHRMKLRINSNDPENEVGEILVKGDGVMLGYFKNEEATREALDDQGWYHTGDLGVIAADGSLYIRGRSKNMLLGPNGQNIYPEEIEDKLNAQAIVAESVVIQNNERLYALIYPDAEEIEKSQITDLKAAMETIRKEINQELPAYEHLSGIKIMEHEFEKTPKKSIKRFLYLNEKI